MNAITFLEYFSFRLLESFALSQRKVGAMVQSVINISARDLGPPKQLRTMI